MRLAEVVQVAGDDDAAGGVGRDARGEDGEQRRGLVADLLAVLVERLPAARLGLFEVGVGEAGPREVGVGGAGVDEAGRVGGFGLSLSGQRRLGRWRRLGRREGDDASVSSSGVSSSGLSGTGPGADGSKPVSGS